MENQESMKSQALQLYNLYSLYARIPLDTTPNVWTHIGIVFGPNKTKYNAYCSHSAKGNVGFYFTFCEKGI